MVDPRGLAARGRRSRRASAPLRRGARTPAVYRAVAAFLGPLATAEDLTPEAVRAYRDRLERAGRSPATVAKHLSALRDLVAAVGADRP